MTKQIYWRRETVRTIWFQYPIIKFYNMKTEVLTALRHNKEEERKWRMRFHRSRTRLVWLLKWTISILMLILFRDLPLLIDQSLKHSPLRKAEDLGVMRLLTLEEIARNWSPLSASASHLPKPITAITNKLCHLKWLSMNSFQRNR